MLDLLLKIGPWLAALAAIIGGLFMRQQAKTVTAEAKQTVAEANAKVDASNAAAAQSGSDAAKERTNVENDIAAKPVGDSTDKLRNDWSRD